MVNSPGNEELQDLKEEIEELKKDLIMLRALEATGVDNWDGYEDAQYLAEVLQEEAGL